MSVITRPRSGLTLVEVVVAIFLTVVALGALGGEAAVALRRLRDSARESLAARLVQGRTERVLSAPCAASSGVDSSDGVAATWSAVTDGHVVRLTQVAQYRTTFGPHTETYQVTGVCQ